MITLQLTNFCPAQIADSGQCFRFQKTEDCAYRLIAGKHVLQVRKKENGECIFDCSRTEFDRLWKPYFDLDTDYAAFIAKVPSSDLFLSSAVKAGSGIRILRQDPWEMLITFIISQRKNIPAIKSAVELLSQKFGEPIGDFSPPVFSFPSAKALAAQSPEILRGCGLGYRADYIYKAACMVASGQINLAAAAALDDDALFALLLTIPGVGVKVANCVLLFGFHRIGAFPRDVWINRIIDEEYGGSFAPEQYSGRAGVIQQYMFYYARYRT